MADVLRKLGLFPGGGNYESVKLRIRQLDLDTVHMRKYLRRPDISREQLLAAAGASRSFAQVFQILGLARGRNELWLKQLIAAEGIDTSHFLGAGWRRGSTTPVVPRRPLAEILVVGRLVSTNGLKRRLIEEGLKKPRCEECLRESWRGKAIPLELDHINGQREDNRLGNLRILCPNCHAQTDTYRGRNIGATTS